MDLHITDKLAVITGAAGAIGKQTARQLAADGARLLLTDTKESELEASADELEGATGVRPATVVADLSSQAGADQVGDRAAELGGADICVHAAGVTGAKGDPLELTDDDYDEGWQLDFMTAVRIARALVPSMVEKGWGRVVYVASENAVQSYDDEMPYNVAKAALVNFTKGTGQAYAPKGVLFNVVSPAFIETDMTDEMMQQRADDLGVDFDEAVESFLDQERPHLVLKRRGRAEEVASVISFLCSDRASFVVGSNYRVDGGSVLAVNT